MMRRGPPAVRFCRKDATALADPAEDDTQNFKTLTAWQAAHQLTLAVYTTTKGFPSEERYALTRQLRRAATSIPMNIADGAGSSFRGNFRRHLDDAARSASETEYQLLLARDLGYLTATRHTELERQVQSVRRVITRLRQAVERQGRERRGVQDGRS